MLILSSKLKQTATTICIAIPKKSYGMQKARNSFMSLASLLVTFIKFLSTIIEISYETCRMILELS